MKAILAIPFLTALLLAPLPAPAEASPHPDVMTIPADLENPPITAGEPAPGKMVLQSLPAYAGTGVAHTLYLPADWVKGKRYPVLIEYLGNNCRVRDNKNIGYALSGGKGFIWVVLPFVGTDRKQDMDLWWGDVDATVAYAKEAVPAICSQWGGDPDQAILTGFSRGAIACNFIGLHDDEISRLWRTVVAVSHYDDAHTAWGMPPEERGRAAERLLRLGETPQLICGEHSSRSARGSDAALLRHIAEKKLHTFTTAKSDLGLEPLTDLEGTRDFVTRHLPQGNVTFIDLPWVNHATTILHRDTLARRQIRDWLDQTLRHPPEKYGEKIVHEDFSRPDATATWRWGAGKWTVAGGVLKGTETPERKHPAGIACQRDYHNAVIDFRFRFDGGNTAMLLLRNRFGNLCRLTLTPSSARLTKDKPNLPKDTPEKTVELNTAKLKLAPGEWHSVRATVRGGHFHAVIDGRTTLEGKHPGIDVAKTEIEFLAGGASILFDDLVAHSLDAKQP